MNIKRLFIVVMLAGFGLISMVYAQQNPLTATVDRSSLTTDDLLTLTVTISGESNNMPQPQQPVLEGFNVVSSGTSSQVSIVNGSMTAQQSTIYHLQPIEIGTLTIGSFSVTLDEQIYNTNPIQVEVTQGTGQPSSSGSSGSFNSLFPPSSLFNSPLSGRQSMFDNKSFVEAEVDNDNPYVGEQVTYTFRYYESIGSFGQPAYDPPNFTGFWHDFQADQKQYNAQDTNGDIYRVTELQTFLFPTNAGEVTIDPTTLSVQGSLLSADTKLETDPITLNVKPLPADAPEDFTGAVGNFRMTASLDNLSVNAGDPITIHVKIDGIGNINTLPDPQWQVPLGWRNFDASSTINTQVNEGKLVGSKDYDYLVIPNSGGTFELPTFSLTFFDPQAEEYRTITHDPLTVTVSGDVVPTQSVPASESLADEVTASTASLLAIRESESVLQNEGSLLTSKSIFWLAWIIPVVMMGSSIGYERRQRYLMENSIGIRRSRAYKQAQRAIKQARRASSDVFASAGSILAQYIEAKLGRSLNGVTHELLGDLLSEHGISPNNIQHVIELLYAVDKVRYSSHQGDGNILDDTAMLITTLEKEFTL